MSFWYLFSRILPTRPGRALEALYWYVTGRKLRARNRLRAAAVDLAFVYDLWIGGVESRRDHADLSKHKLETWEYRPRFSLLLHGGDKATDQDMQKTLHSIERQVYPHWNVILIKSDFGSVPPEVSNELSKQAANPTDRIGAVSRLAEAIAVADGDFVIPVQVGDVFAKMALFRIAEALQAQRGASILYGDQDEIEGHGRRRRPWFKPRWNRELFLAQDYISSAVAIKADCARMAVQNSRSEDPNSFLLIAADAANDAIVHIPHIITHVPAAAVAPEPQARLEAVTRHVRSLGARCAPGAFGTVKVQWPLPMELPLVTIVVPTKDKLELLRPCVEGVLKRTEYKNVELIIVDNSSVEVRTAEFLSEITNDARVRVMPFPAPYNFSAINNFAVNQARGSYVCLLNNDTEVVEPAWLTEMMRYAIRPEIGAVGAKLLYEDGSIQHAGVVIGIGGAAGHAHRHLPANQPGYFRHPHIAQFMSAVTAACLVVEKKKFTAVGGLDEEFAVAFNDVDFCLKLERAGWRNVYVPHAVLVHHESKSRGSDMSANNIERYRRELHLLQKRWGTKTYRDPGHNPNLDRDTETFTIHIP